MIFVESESDSLIFTQENGGDGGRYYYIEREGLIQPLSEIAADKNKNRKRTELRVRKSDLSQPETVYVLTRTNSGHFIPRKHRLTWRRQDVETEEVGDVSELDLSLSDFLVLGSEGDSLDEYEKHVPDMVDAINHVQNKFGFDFYYGGKERTEESIEEDPKEAVVSSLMFDSARSRSRSLNERVKRVHEVFGLTECFEAVATDNTGRTDDTVWLDGMSAVLETPMGEVTMCYQYSFIRTDKVNFSSSQRRFVRPDLLLFPGNWEHALDELRDEVPKGTVVIDMKNRAIDKDDISQFTGYAKAVPESTRIVASLQPISEGHKATLDEIGWDSARLAPGNSQEFRTAVEKALRSASWNQTVEVPISAPDVPDLRELTTQGAKGNISDEELMDRLDADRSDIKEVIGQKHIGSHAEFLKVVMTLGGDK